MTILEIDSVYLYAKEKYRLQKTNLTIEKGEKVALLGSSGSGKSTLLSIANGTIPPTGGKVKWYGNPIQKLTSRQRSAITTIWQDLRLVEELNVIQNINSGSLSRHNLLWALGNLIGFIETKLAISSIEAVGLSLDLLYKNVQQLSIGQRQRVAIARGICQKGEILLADEPLSNLDPILLQKLLHLLLRQKVVEDIPIPETIIMSLHRPDLIHNFNRVVGLQNGKIILDKQTAEINPEDINNLYNNK